MPGKTDLIRKIILESLKSEWRYWTCFSVANIYDAENYSVCEFAVGYGNMRPEIYKVTVTKISGGDYS